MTERQPPEAEAKSRRRALVHRVAIVAALAAFSALSAVVGRRGPALFDAPVIEAVRAADAAWIRGVLEAVSAVTGGAGVAAASALLAATLWRRHGRSVVFLVASVAGAGLVNQLAKWLWERRRPGAARAEPLMPDDYAFPSGHAMLSTAFAVAVWLLARRLRPAWQGPVAVAGGALVLLVGISRIHLDKHYPTDVLGGWALGTAWVLLVHLWYARGRLTPRAGGD